MQYYKGLLNHLVYLLFTVILSSLSVALFIAVIDNRLNVKLGKSDFYLLIIFVFTVYLLAILSVVFRFTKRKTLYRLLFFILVLISVGCIVLFTIIESGLIDKIDSVENLRAFISSFGGYSAILYVVLQFIQVALLPIPSFITIGAGVLLFGPLKAAILGLIGIISGSLFAFFIGRKFGVKAVKWLIGEKNLEKGLKFIEGKGEIFLTFTFIFPFFPDDIMCFVAGITKVKATFFVIMTFIVRTVTVFVSCFSLNNNLIPYNKLWGAIVWIIYFLISISVAILIYKKGDVIVQKIKEKFKGKSIGK